MHIFLNSGDCSICVSTHIEKPNFTNRPDYTDDTHCKCND